MDQIRRIESMEAKMDAALEIIRSLERGIADYRSALPDIAALEQYLSGREWKEDYAADEKGLLPGGLKRGVLSEDGIYDMLEENAQLLQTLRDTADAARRSAAGGTCPSESGDGAAELNWEDDFRISVRVSDGTALVSANPNGLLSLANHLRALAKASPGSHLHLDQFNSLEDGSDELILETTE